MSSPPLGVLGGTFDPVHIAHLRLAEEAREALGLAGVRFVPSANPPHRNRPSVDAVHRLRMVELAIAGQPAFVADDRELRRATPSYTIDTIESLRAEVGAERPICLIVGADAFRLLETWHRWRELLGAAHLVVAHRPGFEILPGTDALGEAFAARRTESSSDVWASAGGRIFPLAITPLDVSASRIRADLAAGRSPRYLLPDSVLRYIDSHHLYGIPDAA
ncbi:MAG: nicotinate-nucleotide adenylyltransferase [Burkholderiales bacterium]